MQLPPKPSLANLKKRAKSILKAHREHDSKVVEYIQAHLPRLADQNTAAILAADFSLQEAQLVVAREYGFASWPKLVEEVKRRAQETTEATRPSAPPSPKRCSAEVMRATELARREAARLGHDYIGTEHQLLGLIASDRDKARHAIDSLGLDIDLDDIVRSVEDYVGSGKTAAEVGSLPYTPRAEDVLAHAAIEADSLGDAAIQHRHMALALLKDPESVSAQIMHTFGIDYSLARQTSEDNTLTTATPQAGEQHAPQPQRHNVFSDGCKRVMGYAREESLRMGNDYIGTEHILQGVIRESATHPLAVLAPLDIDLQALSQSIDDYVASSAEPAIPDGPPFTPRAKAVLGVAANEAVALGREPVEVDHLLLALSKDAEALSAQVLVSFGVSYENLRDIASGGDAPPVPAPN